MKTDTVDLFYAPHGCWEEERLTNCLKKGGVIEGGLKALERGLAKHLAFSFDYFQKLDIKRLRELIATDVFEIVQLPCCLVQVEPIEEEIIPYAREKGMGIIANFPSISGLTAREWGVFYNDFEGIVYTPGQATLLSVLCHPDIDCVLTKLSSVARAEENCFAGRRVAAMTEDEKREIRRRVEAKGKVRFLQREECPPAPPELSFRRSMIYFDLFTRFGYGGARRVVEQFIRQLENYPDDEWEGAAREAIEEVRRACPVLLT
jgi:predicted aldo/keto reductase-like oxidoreductase